jgi:hypothetical protein
LVTRCSVGIEGASHCQSGCNPLRVDRSLEQIGTKGEDC